VGFVYDRLFATGGVPVAIDGDTCLNPISCLVSCVLRQECFGGHVLFWLTVLKSNHDRETFRPLVGLKLFW
jgi:hypothetical protein